MKIGTLHRIFAVLLLAVRAWSYVIDRRRDGQSTTGRVLETRSHEGPSARAGTSGLQKRRLVRMEVYINTEANIPPEVTPLRGLLNPSEYGIALWLVSNAISGLQFDQRGNSQSGAFFNDLRGNQRCAAGNSPPMLDFRNCRPNLYFHMDVVQRTANPIRAFANGGMVDTRMQPQDQTVAQYIQHDIGRDFLWGNFNIVDVQNNLESITINWYIGTVDHCNIIGNPAIAYPPQATMNRPLPTGLPDPDLAGHDLGVGTISFSTHT